MGSRNGRTSREIQAEKSREKIYKAAISLIARKGFVETSVADICRKAQCSVGAFYHHYPSKESLLEDIFYLADEESGSWRTPEKDGLRGVDRIKAYMDSYCDLVQKNGLEFAKHFYTWKNKTFVRKGRPMHLLLEEIIQGGIESGDLRLNLSAEEACDWIFLCARGVVFHWCLHEGLFDLKAKMEEAMDNIFRGIGSGGGL